MGSLLCCLPDEKKNKDRIRVYAFPVNIVSVLSIAVLLPTPSFRVRHTLNKLLSTKFRRGPSLKNSIPL